MWWGGRGAREPGVEWKERRQWGCGGGGVRNAHSIFIYFCAASINRVRFYKMIFKERACMKLPELVHLLRLRPRNVDAINGSS